MNRSLSLSVLSLALAGCATSSTAPHPVSAATAEQKAATIDRVKSLAGTWVLTDKKGQSQSTVFAVTSAGSAVREVMLPGSDHEMTNMYFMDGPSIVMVHYCAMGNQPRMRATAAGADRIHFKFDGITNLHSADEGYMAELILTFKDADNIREEWYSIKDGKLDAHADVFDLKRKKSCCIVAHHRRKDQSNMRIDHFKIDHFFETCRNWQALEAWLAVGKPPLLRSEKHMHYFTVRALANAEVEAALHSFAKPEDLDRYSRTGWAVFESTHRNTNLHFQLSVMNLAGSCFASFRFTTPTTSPLSATQKDAFAHAEALAPSA
jgi:hypothetical protein